MSKQGSSMWHKVGVALLCTAGAILVLWTHLRGQEPGTYPPPTSQVTVSLGSGEYVVSEGQTLDVALLLSQPLSISVTVNYEVTHIETGEVFVGSVEIPPGTQVQTFSYTVPDGALCDGNQHFSLTLTAASSPVTLGLPRSASVTVLDNDVSCCKD
ncbi:MAG: hypothetical protein C4297_01970 [Gemmataceae bacterium]